MGYDMYMVEKDTSMLDQNQAAEAAFNAAVEVRNKIEDQASDEYKAAQALVSKHYAEMSQTDINYFRLNIFGMGQMREDMHTLGMLAFEYNQPEFTPEHFGLTVDEWWADDPDVETTDERLLKARAAAEEGIRWSPPDEPGIPVHKLCSNDGWVVTPLDIASALANYDRADPEMVAKIRESWTNESGENYFDEWITFLKRAQQHGGFQVY